MIFVGLLLTALLGWAVLPRRVHAGPVAGPAFGFALAAFGISLELFALDVAGLGLRWNPWLVLAPWIAAGIWRLLADKPWQRPRIGFKLTLGGAIAALAALLAAAVWLPLERRMPLSSQTWDVWAIWLFKAKAFFIDGEIAAYLARAPEFVGQPGYPLLTPLYSTFLYSLEGEVNAQAVKLVSPLFFFALLAAFYYLARRIASGAAAGAFTAMLALSVLPARVSFDLAGYAEATLAFYLTSAAGFLYLWLSRGRTLDFAAACLSAVAAGWTKNEGLFFLAGFGLVSVVHLIRARRPWVEWLWLIPLPAALFGAWSAMRSAAGVEASGFSLFASFEPGLFVIAFGSMLEKAFDWRDFQLAFPLLFASVVAGAALRAPKPFWVLPGLAFWQLTGALLAYASGRNEIEWWLETSADRLLAQVVPLGLLAAAAAFGFWSDRTLTTARVPPRPESPSESAAGAAETVRKPARKKIARRKRRSKG